MCLVCAAFNPFLLDCAYEDLPTAPAGPHSTPSAPPATVPTGPTASEMGDAAASTATTAKMTVGGWFLGSLATGTDTDWIAVTLSKGQAYTIAVAGTGALSSSNDDPVLVIRDASGQQLFVDDDDGPGLYSNQTFAVASTGTYYIDVRSVSSFDAGTYGVSVTEGNRASFNAEMSAGTLIRPDLSWAPAPGTGANVTWSIRSSGFDPANGSALVGLSGAQVQVIEKTMAYVDALSGLNVTQVNPGGTSNDAAIRFGSYQLPDGRGAYAYYPGTASSVSNSGDVWLNNTYVSQSNLDFGTYSYFTVLHEIGHAIGLAHPGDYNASSGGGPITYLNSAQFVQDSHQYTVMSYFDETFTGASSGLGYPDTFMLYDLLAIHQLYGADSSFHSGRTVYGFNTTLPGTAYDFDVNSTPFLSIYDGGGSDLIDLSGYDKAQYLDLQEGSFSNIGGHIGNLSIAYGAKIEDAIGGGGDDTIIGNALRNLIHGGDGEDNIRGRSGKDTLYGGLKDDVLNGGSGHDELIGDDGKDSLLGASGNDQLTGGAGRDTLDGGDGEDTLTGGLKSDTLYGRSGDDVLAGSDGNDLLVGGGGKDTLKGGNGTDRLFGDKGHDRLVGYDGDDDLFGGNGHDALRGSAGDDSLVGEVGEDTLHGGTGNDKLKGRADDDMLRGSFGNDRLNGGSGDDTLIGGAGADEFVFGRGADVIRDFDTSEDTLILNTQLWSGTLNPQQVIAQFGGLKGGDYVLNFGGGDRLTFTDGIDATELAALTSFI